MCNNKCAKLNLVAPCSCSMKPTAAQDRARRETKSAVVDAWARTGAAVLGASRATHRGVSGRKR
jgi:hypothetical protein